MAKPKTDPDKNWLKDLLAAEAEKKKNTPIIAERWWVVDYWPEERYSDEYSDSNWREAKSVIASGYFKTRAEAESFIETHEPEKGATLQIRNQKLRRITEDRWVNW
jgi:hypothetical protein